MGLDYTALSNQLKSAFGTAQASTDPDAVNTLCNSIATAIKTFVEQANVTLIAGSLEAPSGGGPCTGAVIATLS